MTMRTEALPHPHNVIGGAQLISPVEIRDDEGFKGVFAAAEIPAHSLIINLKGAISTEVSRYSVQVGENEHLNLPDGMVTVIDPGYFWKYLNHSCAPNGYINTAERTFRALRQIRTGEEVTFNYLTTEDDMAAPFQCDCTAAQCFGLIRGRKHLTDSQQKGLAATLATHLQVSAV